jgi:hypothetical protein
VRRDFRNPEGTPAADSARYASFSQNSTLSYGGTAFSAGAEWRPRPSMSVAASARHGGTIKTRFGEDVQSEARVPDRYGAGVRYDGITGTTLAARVNWERWSSMQGLTLPGLPVSDVVEYGVGADVAGPRLGGSPILLRVGGRWRELPFGVRAVVFSGLPAAGDIRETAFTGGIGVPLAAGRVLIDIGAQRASRSSDTRSDVSEQAWTLSFGLRVRP